MGFWIYMLIIAILIPLTMLLFGLYFCKKAPKNINIVFGYRTSMSMKNMDTWRFAHRYCGRIWFICGSILLPLSAIAMFFVYGKSENTVGFVGAACALVPVLLIIASLIFTEIALKKTFDQFGRYKNNVI